jgi:hypothetical protein
MDKLPSHVQLNIFYYLSIRDVMRLYQTTREWKDRISHDRPLWRMLYERTFGRGFSNDKWILWAIRRLWSESPSEEMWEAARHVHLTTLDELDAYTWYRLLRGRFLTIDNWRKGKPRRSIFIPEEYVRPIFKWMTIFTHLRSSYGLAVISSNYNGLGFVIYDDTLDDIKPGYHSTATDVVPVDQHLDNASFIRSLSNEEFIVAGRTVYIDKKSGETTKSILVWDIGNLKLIEIDKCPYCIPTLSMTELLPSDQWELTMHAGGWLFLRHEKLHIDEIKNQKYIVCAIYDIRRHRIAAGYLLKEDVQTTLGRVTPNSVLHYYGYTIPCDKQDGGESSQPSYNYRWRAIQVTTRSDTQTLDANLNWYQQEPAVDDINQAKEKYDPIEAEIRTRGYWCSEAYQFKKMKSKRDIQLYGGLGAKILIQHLGEDLFLISDVDNKLPRDVFVVHSLNQPDPLWAKQVLDYHTPIFDQQAIFCYSAEGEGQLLDMYTGKVLATMNTKGLDRFHHIIGPICRAEREDRYVLVDVYSGKILHGIIANNRLSSFGVPPKANPRHHLGMDIYQPTHLEIVGYTRVEMDEYGQV